MTTELERRHFIVAFDDTGLEGDRNHIDWIALVEIAEGGLDIDARGAWIVALNGVTIRTMGQCEGVAPLH